MPALEGQMTVHLDELKYIFQIIVALRESIQMNLNVSTLLQNDVDQFLVDPVSQERLARPSVGPLAVVWKLSYWRQVAWVALAVRRVWRSYNYDR